MSNLGISYPYLVALGILIILQSMKVSGAHSYALMCADYVCIFAKSAEF